MQKTYHQLKSIQCKRLLKDDEGHLLPKSEQCFTILYNESRVSFSQLRQMLQDNSYQESKYVLVMDDEIASCLSDVAPTEHEWRYSEGES